MSRTSIAVSHSKEVNSMSDSRFNSSCNASQVRDVCCIETNRIYDSCRDRDCYENLKVNTSDYGKDIIARTGNIRAKEACIAWTYIDIDPVRFNRGFYSVNIRYYIKIAFEACIGNNKPLEFEGVTAIDKKVVLFGGEKRVNIFRSDFDACGVCGSREVKDLNRAYPTAVVEATDPIILDVKVFDKHSLPTSCCCCCDIPENVICQLESPISDTLNDCERFLTVSLGLFSVIRLIRPAQLLVNATEYCVPDKECIAPREENPCAVFNSMAFPSSEFCPQLSQNVCNH